MEKPNREEIIDMIGKLKGILKTSKDNKQQIRVSKDIKYWKSELAKHKPSNEKQDDLKNENSTNNKESLINNISIENVSYIVKDTELNQLYTFIKYLDEEYIVALNEYQLKLTFNQSITRSNLQNILNDIKFNIKDYVKIAEQSLGTKQDKIILDPTTISKNKQSTQAEYRKLLSKTGVFLIDLIGFVKLILTNHENGGNFILNPNSIIETATNFENKSVLNNKNIIEGLYILQQFIEEIIDYFNFRTITQINKTIT